MSPPLMRSAAPPGIQPKKVSSDFQPCLSLVAFAHLIYPPGGSHLAVVGRVVEICEYNLVSFARTHARSLCPRT